MWQTINSYASTEQAIQNPFSFYFVMDKDWSSTHNYDYWNINFTSGVGVNNVTILKTVYDPSISGFTLPKTAAFTGFTSTGSSSQNANQFNVNGSFDRGWNFYTNGWKTGGLVYFYGLGNREVYGVNYGKIVYVEKEGFYWSCGTQSDSGGGSLDLGANFVTTLSRGNCRSSGFNCRPVKE